MTPASTDDPETVLRFWFAEVQPAQWWKADPAFDALIARRFGRLHQVAAQGGLSAWRSTARGCLAEVIVLDQFSRNLYRGQAQAFASDGLALMLARQAVARGLDADLAPAERHFLYLPWMHAESLAVHVEAEVLFTRLGKPEVLREEHRHRAILERFGRYPARNAALGRATTATEAAFLAGTG